MKRSVLAVALVLVLCVPGLAGIDDGGTEPVGPEWLDLAVRVAIDAESPNFVYDRWTVEDAVYAFLVHDPDGPDPLAPWTLYRVDPHRGQVDAIAELPSSNSNLESDAERLYTVSGTDLVALAIPTGEIVWQQPIAVGPGENLDFGCPGLAVQSDVVVIGCPTNGRQVMVSAFTVDDGEPLWSTLLACSVTEVIGPDVYCGVEAAFASVALGFTQDAVVVAASGSPSGGIFMAAAMERATGATRWSTFQGGGDATDQDYAFKHLQLSVEIAAMDDQAIIGSLDRIFSIDLSTGAETWRYPPQGVVPPYNPNIWGDVHVAEGNGGYYAPFAHRLHRFTPAGTLEWPARPEAADTSLNLGEDGLWVGEELVWSAAATGLAILSARDGSVHDEIPVSENYNGATLNNGWLALLSQPPSRSYDSGFVDDTRERLGPTYVSIYGQTMASIQPDIDISAAYPPLGRAVTIDATGTVPGLLAEDLRFTVHWGDGATDSGPGPVFQHAYDEAGDVTVVVRATNSAGQQSTWSTEIHPGIAEPNFISDAFSPENQESTFFTLGIILTLIFAGLGALRIRRKRGLLRKEMQVADGTVARLRSDPDKLREALRDHRARARRLFLQGRLDEGSTGILERHIDELLRDHRLSKVEADLSFLPHGLFRSMQEMLRDARVTQLERNNFLIALDADGHLSPGEKKRVKRHVETWHREDVA